MVWRNHGRSERDAYSYFDKYVRVVKTKLHSTGERHDPRKRESDRLGAMYVTVRNEIDALYVVKELDGKKAKPTVRKEEKPDEQLVIRVVPRSSDFRLKVSKVPSTATQ